MNSNGQIDATALDYNEVLGPFRRLARITGDDPDELLTAVLKLVASGVTPDDVMTMLDAHVQEDVSIIPTLAVYLAAANGDDEIGGT